MRLIVKLLAFIILVISSFILFDRYDVRTPPPFEALHQINPMPKTEKLIQERKYLQAQEYLAFFMQYPYVKNDSKAQKILQEIQMKRESSAYKTEKIIDGILKGKSDELSGQISAGVSDLFLFGDLRDLTIEGYHKYRHQEVDEVLVALSSLGIAASAATLFSAGTATPVKSSLSFLKFAKKSGKLPPWLEKHLIKSAKEVQKTKTLDPYKKVSKDIYEMIENSGINSTLTLLAKTDNIDDLQKTAAFAKQFKKESAALIDILGKEALKSFELSRPRISKQAYMHAATYGKAGIKRISLLGEKGFLKSLKQPIKTSRILKIFDKNSALILKSILDSIFYLLILIAFVILV